MIARPLRTVLPLAGLLFGCGTAPALTSLKPLPTGLTARIVHCETIALALPADLEAQACYRAAMLAAGRRDALLDRLKRAREAAPTDGERWLAEGLAMLAADPAGADILFEQCSASSSEPAACAAGRARAHLAAERNADARTQAESAFRARPEVPEFAAWAAIADARAGDTTAARARLDPLTVGWPDRVAVIQARSELAIAEGDFSGARTAIAELRAAAPDGATSHLLAARLHIMLDDDDAAASALRKAVAADRTAIGPRSALAHLLVRLGRTDAAIEVFAGLAEQAPDDPLHAIALGDALLTAGQADQARAWATRARALDPDRGRLLWARASIAAGDVDGGLAMRDALYGDPSTAVDHRIAIARALSAAGRVALAESEFARAVVHHQKDPIAWTGFAGWLVDRDRLDRAEALLRQAVVQVPDAPAVHAGLADVFERQGNRAGARLALDVAARLDPENAVHEDELARLEFLDGQLIDALARWEALIVHHPNAERPLRRLTAAYRALDEPEKAVALMERIIDRHPDDPELRGRLGETLLEAGEKARAVGVLESALAGGAEPERLQPLLATALADVGRADEADALFAEALKADPGNRPLRLTFAAFRAARGDRSGAVDLYTAQLARDPSDPDARSGLERLVGADFVEVATAPANHPRAAVDRELATLAARAPPAFDDNAGAVLRDERRVVVDDRGVAEVHHRRAILIQRPGGVERFATASVSFHVDTPPEIVRARTIGPDGHITDMASQTIRNPQAGTLLYGDNRELVVRFAELEVGAIVDYEIITRRPHPDLPDVWWDGYVLGNLEPTVEATYVLDMPAGTTVTVKTDGLDPPEDITRGQRRTLRFARSNLPAYRPGADIDTPPPSVRVSSMSTWAEVDRWYADLFDPRSQPSPQVIDRARLITRGKVTRRERIAAIYGFVEQSIRYVGVEFGIGAYQPRPPESTLAQHQGDCKDMTALMVALLAAIDIDAHPVLVKPRGGGLFDPDHPSPGQFSHVILHVPAEDLWLDATAGLATLDAVPAPLRDRHGLIVDGRGGRLMVVPTGEPERNALIEQRTFRLDETGGGTLTATMTLSGDMAGYARQELGAADPEAREAILKAPGHLLDRGRVPDSVSIVGLEHPDEPVTIEARLTHRDLVAVRLDGALVLPLDMSIFVSGPRDRFGGGSPSPAGRVFERRVTLIPPAGYRFDWAPVDLETEGPISLRLSERRERDRTTLISRMTMTGEAIDAEQREVLLDAARAVQAEVEQDLTMLPAKGFDRVGFIEAIIAERPDQPRLKTFLGQALIEAERPLEATLVLVDALEADPTDEQAASLMMYARSRLGSAEALEEKLRALVAGPSSPPAAVMALIALYVESERPEAGLAILDGMPPDRRPADAAAVRIELLSRMGRLAEALGDARALAEQHPGNAGFLALLGKTAETAGELHVAEQAWRRALDIHPDDGTALNNLAWSMRDRSDARDEAISLARRATVLMPDSSAAWDTLAELFFRAGRIDAALDANAHALEHATDDRARLRARRAAYGRGPDTR